MSPSGVRRQWEVVPSDIAQKTHNPLRNVVENLRLEPNPEKSMIALSIGDPTVFGNLKPPVEVIEAMQESLLSIRYNGYAPSTGHQEAREAVARYSSSAAVTVHSQDVVLCSGCSCALDLAITVLANPGQNILVPRPGFPLYRTLAESLGIHVKSYNLRPERGWEVDTMHLEQQIDASTAALVVSNPSNPCGSVYSRQHLRDILQVARAKFVPVIADEIYEHMVFPGQTFHPLASVSDDVPILACSGITKRFLVPGWRMGWITIHDRHGIFETAGCHANIAYDMLKGAKGLTPLMPKGAMYMMVGINMAEFPDFASELNFVEQMVTEESVFCLPSKCFDYTNYMRLVLTVPEEQLREACHRITAFCKRYHRPEDADSHKGNTDVVETCTSNCSAALRESRDLIVPKDASISP
ncbi:tyrosine aminotransferase isoform X3 [Cryptotermes secundus]|uniref:tyrosine aminotransferase isoform X3 n=1 Tax=Cryptotermes secundus TaxID=105785 RepID=UPI000CD7B3A7|nr:tyrosine aminotransferase isoform X3 [Cryptotermes secundus]